MTLRLVCQALDFDEDDFAAFELFILRRPGAAAEYGGERALRAERRFEQMSDAAREALKQTIIAGLPGKMTNAYTLEAFQAAIDAYKQIDAAQLRANLAHFLRAVVPVAEESGVFLAIHPDDPPRRLFGLPRIVSTDEDIRKITGLWSRFCE